MIKSIFAAALSMVLFLFTGCVGLPDNLKPVENFEVQKYLGQWYEIARLDHRFERGLTKVTANYSLREDGGLKVVNAGYAAETGTWKRAEGKAYFVQDSGQGFLKVSFFGPFYASYVVFELDHAHYQYALVAGPNRSYLWLLSRTPTMAPALQAEMLAKAKAMGFDTSQLIMVDQGTPPAARP